jgi:hypothetical protein
VFSIAVFSTGQYNVATAFNGVSVLWGIGNGAFNLPVRYFPVSNPALDLVASVAVGDFNGDGKLDLVTANSLDYTVSVLLGNGGGTFGSSVSYPVGIEPQSVAIGDFNGDGKPDIVAANIGSNTVSVLLGNGDGTFGPKTDYPVGMELASVAVGDFTGDGKVDLVTANATDNTVSVLPGNGDGTFAPKVDFPVGIEPVSVVVGDFNGDGKVDLAVANSYIETVSVLLNTTVSSPAELLSQVAGAVQTLNLPGNAKNGLLSKLDAAQAALMGTVVQNQIQPAPMRAGQTHSPPKANYTAAQHQIQAVILQLEGLVKAGKLDRSSATVLISDLDAALALISDLDAGLASI